MINFTATGRVATPPEAKNAKIWSFSLAINEWDNVAKAEKTTFIRVKTFNEPKFLPGAVVEVRGRVEMQKVQDGKGFWVDYVADRIQVHTWGKNEKGEDAGRKVKGDPAPDADLPF